MNGARADTRLPVGIGWTGKLPTRGDFVGRGLPRAWARTWNDWLERALAGACQALGSTTLRTRLLAMPPWQCVVLPGAPGELVWCGVIVPSTDRVGRVFPLLLAEAYEEAVLDATGLAPLQARALCLADWLDRIGALATPKAFEAGAAQWVATAWHAGPAEETLADLRRAWPGSRSFWWTREPLDDAAPPLAEAWPPRDELVLDWLRD